MRIYLSLLLLLIPMNLAAQERVAFIVGNGIYEHAPPLPNPTNDAHLIAKSLEELNFAVTVHENLDRWDIASKLSEFLKETEGAETTVFYFAGHGMQFEGRNYLLGTDAQLRSELDIEAEALDLEQVTRLLRKGSRAAMVFVDACRDNPIATAFYQENFSTTRSAANQGLAAPSSSFEGAMIAFAASPGQVAYDGDEAHSPFAQALARHLPTANIEILTLMKRVIRDVKLATGDRQTPMISNDLTREIYLKLDEGGDATIINIAQEEAMYEAAAGLNSERAWDIFLERYPNGQMYAAALAEREKIQAERLAKLSGSSLEEGEPIAITRDVALQAETDLGMAREDAVEVQAALNRLGYDAGVEDGVLGQRSRKAIADFQAASALPSTGVVTKGTAVALGVEIELPEESDGAVYSSRNARRYNPDQLAAVESDPRLIEAARILQGKEYVYGFYDGHLYIALLQWCCDSWDTANYNAKNSGGHLAVITDPRENQFVYDLVSGDDRFWEQFKDEWVMGPTFGLYQKDGAREPDGGWSWVNGEESGYINWLRPDFPNNNEGRASIGGYGHRPPGSRYFTGSREFGTWDDYVSMGRGYVIEIE